MISHGRNGHHFAASGGSPRENRYIYGLMRHILSRYRHLIRESGHLDEKLTRWHLIRKIKHVSSQTQYQI